jgi:hypothetical protein
VVGTEASNKDLDLEPIEEEREHNRSRTPSMAESAHRTNSNKSGSNKETKEDSISIVSLSCRLYAIGAWLGFCKNGIRN